jgi:DNA-binding response OmpR family regulator
MRNIVIVEDNADLRASLIDILSSETSNVVGFESSEAFLTGCFLQAINIVILDLNLPGLDGIGLANRLKLEAPHVGIIMLTARGAAEDVGTGYNSGADIYLVKPSSELELKGAIEALWRRTGRNIAGQSNLELDARSMTLTGPAGKVALSDTEAELLKQFILAAENRLERNVIGKVLGIDDDAKSGTLEVRIVRLRKKLAAAGFRGKTINVVRSWGYQLAVKIELS